MFISGAAARRSTPARSCARVAASVVATSSSQTSRTRRHASLSRNSSSLLRSFISFRKAVHFRTHKLSVWKQLSCSSSSSEQLKRKNPTALQQFQNASQCARDVLLRPKFFMAATSVWVTRSCPIAVLRKAIPRRAIDQQNKMWYNINNSERSVL